MQLPAYSIIQASWLGKMEYRAILDYLELTGEQSIRVVTPTGGAFRCYAQNLQTHKIIQCGGTVLCANYQTWGERSEATIM
jgi:heme oxygenase